MLTALLPAREKDRPFAGEALGSDVKIIEMRGMLKTAANSLF
jgi:hypothetical protein